jgi:hypothetical protein
MSENQHMPHGQTQQAAKNTLYIYSPNSIYTRGFPAPCLVTSGRGVNTSALGQHSLFFAAIYNTP